MNDNKINQADKINKNGSNMVKKVWIYTLIPFRYVELYPEYRPHYRPFGFGYEIYIRVSILYTKNRIKVPRM